MTISCPSFPIVVDVLLLFAGLSLLPSVVFVFSLLYAQHLVSGYFARLDILDASLAEFNLVLR